MPNGFTGSTEEFIREEIPFIKIDKRLKKFSRKYLIRIIKNYHSWPSRSLEWGIFLRRKISISLTVVGSNKYDVWICAWFDRREGRYWKNDYLRNNVEFSEIENKLENILQKGRLILNSWKKNDLELVKK